MTDLEKAFVGGVAVILGGLITILSNWTLETIRFKREKSQRSADSKAELRLAVRVILEELAECERLVREAGVNRRFWQSPRQLPTSTWNEYRQVIATQVESPLDWRVITLAFDSVNNLNWIEATARSEAYDDPPRVQNVKELRKAWTSIREGMRKLEQTIQVQGPASRMMVEDKDLWPLSKEEEAEKLREEQELANDDPSLD